MLLGPVVLRLYKNVIYQIKFETPAEPSEPRKLTDKKNEQKTF